MLFELYVGPAFGILYWKIWAVLHFREHLLVPCIYLFQLFSLPFSYFKVLLWCYLYPSLWRNLCFCYEVELVEEYILEFLWELRIVWDSCTMVLGNESSLVVIIIRERFRLKPCCLAWFQLVIPFPWALSWYYLILSSFVQFVISFNMSMGICCVIKLQSIRFLSNQINHWLTYSIQIYLLILCKTLWKFLVDIMFCGRWTNRTGLFVW